MTDKFEGLRKAVRIGYQVSTDEIRALLEAYDALAKPDPKVPLLEAFKAGKKIMRSYKWAVDWTGQANVGWEECPNDGKGLWLDFNNYEYRIEEPAPQQAEVEALRADAGRFRWFCEHGHDVDMFSDGDNQVLMWTRDGSFRGRTFAEAIDAARAAHGGKA